MKLSMGVSTPTPGWSMPRGKQQDSRGPMVKRCPSTSTSRLPRRTMKHSSLSE
jgi:hypothetical protein